jgi:hypothetical protein
MGAVPVPIALSWLSAIVTERVLPAQAAAFTPVTLTDPTV